MRSTDSSRTELPIGAGGLIARTVSFSAMMSRVRVWWRTMRNQPLWLQFLLAVCLVPVGLFALFLLYAFVVIAIFGI